VHAVARFARRIIGLDAAGAESANYGAGNPRRSAAFPRAGDNPRAVFSVRRRRRSRVSRPCDW